VAHYANCGMTRTDTVTGSFGRRLRQRCTRKRKQPFCIAIATHFSQSTKHKMGTHQEPRPSWPSRCYRAILQPHCHSTLTCYLVLCRLPHPVPRHPNRRNTFPRPSHAIYGRYTVGMDAVHCCDVANAHESHQILHQTLQRRAAVVAPLRTPGQVIW
jgi:hypothetical protein